MAPSTPTTPFADLAFEINDAGLRATEVSGGPDPASDASDESPGYALIDGNSILTGREAFDRARLQPRYVHHRFWRDLDTAPLGRPFPRDMSTASLAHAHLTSCWNELRNGASSVILTLPSSLTEHQLGLVLGIARASGIPVEGLVDAAVAAAVDFDARRLLYLDIELHRLVLTELVREDENYGRRRVITADDLGWVALNDALARHLSELFVRATRFDPLHSAEPEQELYRRLPAWLEALREAESLEITLGAGRRKYTVDVSRREVLAAAIAVRHRALDLVRGALTPPTSGTALLLTHRLARVPGIRTELEKLEPVGWAVLPPGAAGRGALRARESILAPGEEFLPFITRLGVLPEARAITPRVTARAAVGSALCAAARRRIPTHVVQDGLAYPITDTPFLAVAPFTSSVSSGNGHDAAAPSCRILLRDGAVVAKNPAGDVFVNGERLLESLALEAGDRVVVGRAGDHPLELHLIAVVD